MKKSLSLLLAVALVLSMFGSLAYAADTTLTPQQQFDALKAAGVFDGDQNGNANLESEMQRQQLAKILVKLAELNEEKPAKGTYSDVPDTLWSYGFVEAATKAQLMEGKGKNSKGENIFDPKGDVKIQELAKVLVLALKLEYDETATVEGASAWAGGFVQAAVKNGLIPAQDDYNVKALRELLVTGSYKAYTAIQAAKEAAKDLSVTDVVANNLKTVYVHFSQAVNKDTVNKDTVKVEGKDVDKVALSADGKVATVVLKDAVKQTTELEVKVNGVKTAAGKEVKDFSKKVIAADTTLPSAIAAVSANHKEIEIQFSEPMSIDESLNNYFQGWGSIKLDGATPIIKASADYVKNTVTLEFPGLLKVGTLKLEVSDIEDFAGYKILPAAFDVVVTEDKDAPVLTGATLKNRNEIEVTFNERLSEAGTFKVNGVEVAGGNTALDGNKVTLKALGLNLGAVVEIKLAYKGQKDIVGNEIKDELTYSFKTEDDTVLPTVSMKLDKDNKITLTFSKSMTDNVGTIALLNDKKEELNPAVEFKDGAITAKFKNDSNNTVIELSGADLNLNNHAAGSYILSIKDMKDATVRQNPLPDQSIEVKSYRTAAPVVNDDYTVTAATETKNDTVTFYFNEPMDVDTAKNLSNYVLTGVGAGYDADDGSALYPANTPLSAVKGASFKSISSDGKKVTLTVPNIADQEPSIMVYALKDTTGNMMVANTVDVHVANLLAIALNGNKAVAKNKIEVTFNQDIAVVDPSAFAVAYKVGATEKVIPFISASIDGDKVTFTTASDIPANALDAQGDEYYLKLTNKNAIQNIFGEKMEKAAGGAADNGDAIANSDIIDGIKPAVTKAERGGAGAHDTFVITFDEALAAPPAEADITIRDSNNNRVDPGDYTVTLGAAADANKLTITIDVTFSSSITVIIEAGVVADATVGNTNALINVNSGSTKIIVP